MAGHRPFSELEAKMPPELVKEAHTEAREILEGMLLSEIRNFAGKTQVEVAEGLGQKQPGIAKQEAQTDMMVGTLRKLIQAYGGELQLTAKLPGGDIPITQFVVDELAA